MFENWYSSLSYDSLLYQKRNVICEKGVELLFVKKTSSVFLYMLTLAFMIDVGNLETHGLYAIMGTCH